MVVRVVRYSIVDCRVFEVGNESKMRMVGVLKLRFSVICCSVVLCLCVILNFILWVRKLFFV